MGVDRVLRGPMKITIFFSSKHAPYHNCGTSDSLSEAGVGGVIPDLSLKSTLL